MKIEVKNGEAVAKRAFWLAWQACGQPCGMGWLQDNPSATEEDVWNNIAVKGDYQTSRRDQPRKPYADYVFGRMMKLDFQYDNSVTVRDTEPRKDYQAWCHKYPSYKALIEAAVASLE